jgi:hypothetical protein
MYHSQTGERLPVTDAAGAPLGATLHLTTVDVVPLEGEEDGS